MDQADDELRVTIQHIWPLQAKKMLDLLIPRNDCLNNGKLTVGKIYAGLLILESWRNTRFGQIDSGLPVSSNPSLTNSPSNMYPWIPFRMYYKCSNHIIYYLIPIWQYFNGIFKLVKMYNNCYFGNHWSTFDIRLSKFNFPICECFKQISVHM